MIFVSSLSFCNGLIKEVKDLTPMKLWAKKKNGKIFYCCISGNLQVEKFLNWMYDGASIYLDRKYEIYKKFLKDMLILKNKRAMEYSQYPNISYDKARKKWISSIRLNKKTKHLGRFNTEDGALAAQKLAQGAVYSEEG